MGSGSFLLFWMPGGRTFPGTTVLLHRSVAVSNTHMSYFSAFLLVWEHFLHSQGCTELQVFQLVTLECILFLESQKQRQNCWLWLCFHLWLWLLGQKFTVVTLMGLDNQDLMEILYWVFINSVEVLHERMGVYKTWPTPFGLPLARSWLRFGIPVAHY